MAGGFKFLCNVVVLSFFLQGEFQVYVRISHFTGEAPSPDFSPPFTDPLIDEVFFEFDNVSASSFADRLSSPPRRLTREGEFRRVVVVMQVNAHCAQGWNGTACETFCNVTDGQSSCIQGELFI